MKLYLFHSVHAINCNYLDMYKLQKLTHCLASLDNYDVCVYPELKPMYSFGK